MPFATAPFAGRGTCVGLMASDGGQLAGQMVIDRPRTLDRGR